MALGATSRPLLATALCRVLLARAALGGLLLAVAGCGGLPPAAVQQLGRARQDYDAGRLDQAEAQLSSIIDIHGHNSGVEEVYYLRGLCRARQQRLDQACGDLEHALESSRPELVCRARAQLGHIAYSRGEYEQAASAYAAALEDLPATVPGDVVYFQYGDSLQRLGEWQRAREILPKVWHGSPDSPLGTAARRKFSWPYDYFTIQCGAFEQPERAHELAADLRAARFDVAVERDVRRDPALQRVYVGRFSRYDAALATLQHVRGRVPEALIVP